MGTFNAIFDGAIPKSQRFSAEYSAWAGFYNLPFLDTSKVIVSSKVDGIHFDASEHGKLGNAVAAKIKELIG
jgi:hypothetical protein